MTAPRRDLVLVALCSAFLLTVTLVSPFGRDQGNYAYAAWAWEEGAALYRDVYVFKPPGTVLVHALALTLFGHSMTAIRLLDVIWEVATALLITASARRLGEDRLTSVLAGLLYTFLYAQQSYWTTSQTDGWMCLPAALAVYAGVRARGASTGGARVWSVAAGMALGLAIPMKYTAGAAVLPVLPLLFWGRPSRAGLVHLVLFGVGLAVVVLACGAWLWASGAWPAFLECQSGLVSSYVDVTRRFGPIEGSWQVVKNLFTNGGMRLVGPWVFVGAVVLLARRVPDRGLRASVPLLWFMAGFVSCVSQGKLFVYHHLFLFPGLAWVAAAPIAALCGLVGRRLPWVWSRPLVALGAASLVVSASRLPGEFKHMYAVAGGGETLDHQWRHDRGYRNSSFSLADDLALADRLRKTTGPEDRVFLWGFEPLVNFVAERQTVSRFLYNYPFAASWGNPAYERELLEALTSAPPAVFVVSSGDATSHVTGNKDDSRALFEKFAALRAFVEQRYGPPEKLRRFDVYVRLDRTPDG